MHRGYNADTAGNFYPIIPIQAIKIGRHWFWGWSAVWCECSLSQVCYHDHMVVWRDSGLLYITGPVHIKFISYQKLFIHLCFVCLQYTIDFEDLNRLLYQPPSLINRWPYGILLLLP